MAHIIEAEMSIMAADVANSPITTISRTPPPETFVDGMKLGSSVDAITGDRPRSALDPNTIKEEIATPTGASEHYEAKVIEDVRTIEESKSFKVSSSITVPVDALSVGAGNRLDFSSSTSSEGCIVLYTIHWERVKDLVRIADGAKLSDEAMAVLKDDKTKFRNAYGDYFVYQYSQGAQFTAIWKCTANSTTALRDFKSKVNVNVKSGDVNGSAKMETAINSAAEEHNVSIEVKFTFIGKTDKVDIDPHNVGKTFDSFRENHEPVPTYAYFHHYSVIDTSIPNTIAIEPTVYRKMCTAFQNANLVLFLSAMAPGNTSSRHARKNNIMDIFRTIHAQRSEYERNIDLLLEPFEDLESIRKHVMRLLDRQDLVIKYRSQTVDDIKKLFVVHSKDKENREWVQAVQSKQTYEFGRMNFTPEEAEKYAVHTVLAESIHMDWKLRKEQSSSLNFPGGAKVHGPAIGIQLRSHWDDGSGGYWCIPSENPLGKSEFKIDLKTESSRGMNWSLFVTYINSKDYDE